MNYHIVFTQVAEDDLIDIFDYIAFQLQNPLDANRQLERIEKAINNLSNMPKKYPVWDHEHKLNKEVRFFPVDNFLIFYYIHETEQQVVILHVLYSKRSIHL